MPESGKCGDSIPISSSEEIGILSPYFPGLALLMLNVALHSGVASFTLRLNTGARTALIAGAAIAGLLLGGVFFPRLSAWGRRSGKRSWRVIAAVWVAAAPLTALFGLHQYVFNEPLRVFANFFLGMAFAPAYQLFFERFPVRWRGTWFGVCTGAGVLVWDFFLISAASFPPPDPATLFHPLLAQVYWVHAGSLVLLAALCIHALGKGGDREKYGDSIPISSSEEIGILSPHFSSPHFPLVRAIMASTCLVYFIGGVIDRRLTPVFADPPPVAFRLLLSVLAVMAAPVAGWLMDRWPERIFHRFLPVCCGLFILTPALAALDAAHALHVAAGFPLLPQLAPAAAPVDGEPCAHCGLKGFLVHISQHQHLAGGDILGDGGNKPPLIESNSAQIHGTFLQASS